MQRRKPRLLLAAMLLHNGRTVSTRELTAALWGDTPPPSARANLQAYVSTLRVLLGASRLITTHDGYRLLVEPDDLDADVFERLVGEARTAARTGRPRDAVRCFTAALDLWQGDVLETLELTEPLHDATAGLRELRLSAEDELMDAHLDAGEHTHVVAEFRRLVRAEPFREGRWGRLMTALHRCGRDKEALEAYQELYTFLDGELGVGPCAELRALHGGILAAADAGTGWAATAVETPWRGVRPYVTVVGRDHERAELRELALRGGLVTVTGPGGCGKSALALDTARTLTAGFPGGVTVVSPVAAGTALPAVPPGPGTGPRALFVLDDCEDLPDAAALARGLLSRPGSTVVATSRSPLRISGEVTWPLSPLPTPKASEETAATRLFVQRAVQATAGSRTTAPRPALVARICRRLDGLPLAIELAAARLRVFSLPELADRLDTGLDCLLPHTADARGQDTLTSALSRDHARLCSHERQLLRLLAETEGVFSLSDVEAAAEPYLLPGCALQALAALVEQSFVHSLDTPAGRRFRLLAPTRAFVAHLTARRPKLETRG
ncbi:AfsR/SARP family transcriptional regulator [Streptomyces sp. STR69]|uniref:AfsR/SARP family transcriptional regulator n=1 Tax=Streptomyces sp. STR69 TaxID=1796942 RepID=UPI0021C5B99F|nr:BTAD domain-containing putative transcriptional regulator [Streptomyces sp. STR69]